MSKIAAIGRRHFVGCLAAVGAERLPCDTPEAFALAAGQFASGAVPALVLVDQRFAACKESIEALRRRGAVVILLPAEAAEGHPALDAIRSLVEVAAGANILGEY